MSDEMTSATFTEQEWSHFEAKTLNEECGLFGVWGHPDAARLTYFGLHALQHRGQEGAGILVNNNGKLNRHRGLGLVTEVFRDEKDLEELTGSAAIGHVRYATAGSANINNIQPFQFEFHDGALGLAHNVGLKTLGSFVQTMVHQNQQTRNQT